jgi:predicted small metal-binding protein
MSEFNTQKDEAKELLENVKEEAKSVSGLMEQAQNLVDRVMTRMREMVEYVEQNWFMGEWNKMVACMVGVMMIILGIFLALVF